MKKDNLEITKELVDKLLGLMGIEAGTTIIDDAENKAIRVQVETANPGVLIGFHGETLSSLQLILNIMVSKAVGEWIRVIVNVGDYREKREEILKRMGLNAAQKVRFSGEPVILLDLTASDRRIVHMVLSEYDDITSESEGEGKDRKLVIKPKKQN